jgi:transcriptional regulator with XRE-family HTH domain
MDIDFSTWLIGELEKRGWSNSELARRAGVTQGAISHVISGTRSPGTDLCRSIARAFKIPPTQVFRRAGLLPSPPVQDDPTLDELDQYIKLLSPQAREEILRYVIFRYREEQS